MTQFKLTWIPTLSISGGHSKLLIHDWLSEQAILAAKIIDEIKFPTSRWHSRQNDDI